MKRILVISHDKVGKSMAGPGIRYHQIAKELSKKFDVTLATFNPEYLYGITGVPYKHRDIKVFDFRPAFEDTDIIFALWLSDEMITYAKQRGKIIIFDLYAPVPVEELVGRALAGKVDTQSDYDYITSLRNYKKFFCSGDFFVCSNPIQKDLWSGFALAAESTLPSSFANFSPYDRIGLLPMGIDTDELPTKKPSNPFPGHFAAIKKTDFLIVWTGGIWDWFDAVTPIKAMAVLYKKGLQDIKLVFLGTKHPNRDVPEMEETNAAYQTAAKLGLKDKNVFFLEGWIEYSKRLSYLLNASLALYAHKPSIEARFSHRTRVLDHILCGLPTIVTRGDYLGSIIEEKGYGIGVSPKDPDAMAHAIEQMYNDQSLLARLKSNIQRDQHEYSWSNSTKELIDFVNTSPKPRPQYHAPQIIETPTGSLRQKVKRIIPQKIKDAAKRHLK